MSIINDLAKAIAEASKPKTSAYDTAATVRRIENGVAWVHIPGGVDETPVKLTINAKAGDTVQVRVSGGRAFLVGNASAPPTDDTTAKLAVRQIGAVKKVVEVVKGIAEGAARIAGNTNQYFWHVESGADTGAHITEIPQKDFLDDPSGGNLLARSNGIAMRVGMTELSQFTPTAVNFLDGEGNETSNIIASFGGNQSVIGKTSESHLQMDHHSIKGIDKEGAVYFHVGDLREDDGSGHFLAEISEHFADNASQTITLTLTVYSIIGVYIWNDPTTSYTFDGNRTITLGSGVYSQGDTVTVIYTTTSRYAKLYTLGIRHVDDVPAPMSIAIGLNNISQGFASCTIGRGNTARLDQAMAVGNDCHAYGTQSFAGGLHSRADGNHAFAFGASTYAGGGNSAAFGTGTTAVENHSLVCGRYNDGSAESLFAVGNGTSTTPKTVFHVDKSGDTKVFQKLDVVNKITAGAVTSYTPSWTNGQTPSTYHCVVSAGICSFFYMGAAVAHSAGASLGQLPVGARPSSNVYAPFVKMSGGVVGTVSITSAGVITVGQISNTSNTGRIYFNCTFPVV